MCFYRWCTHPRPLLLRIVRSESVWLSEKPKRKTYGSHTRRILVLILSLWLADWSGLLSTDGNNFICFQIGASFKHRRSERKELDEEAHSSLERSTARLFGRTMRPDYKTGYQPGLVAGSIRGSRNTRHTFGGLLERLLSSPLDGLLDGLLDTLEVGR